jgi:membrane-associated phospholipid phosphatase
LASGLTLPDSDGTAVRLRDPVDRSDLAHRAGRLIVGGAALWLMLCATGWLLTGPLHATGFERWDGAADRWFAAHRSPTWNAVTHGCTLAAETLTVVGVGVVAVVALRLGLGRWREAIMVTVCVAGEVVVFVATTMLVDRARPAVARLDSAPPTSSFPSGHTAAAVALYGALAAVALAVPARRWLQRVALTAAILVPVAVGVSRIYRGMHYPTDVLAGALLGLAWLLICRRTILTPRR